MKIIKTRPLSKDKRGEITQIIEVGSVPIVSVLYIRSKKGAIRANHYHHQDTHYTYLLSGKYRYFEKKLTGTKIEKRIILPGEMVVTSPLHIHAMKFLEDSEWVVCTTQPRGQADYEKDTVRVKLI